MYQMEKQKRYVLKMYRYRIQIRIENYALSQYCISISYHDRMRYTIGYDTRYDTQYGDMIQVWTYLIFTPTAKRYSFDDRDLIQQYD